MKIKSLIYAIVAFILPWILIGIGIAKPIYDIWLYVGSITWFLTSLFIFLSFYKF